jgi:hypothetical protein
MVEPRAPGATGFFDDSVGQLNDALDARRDRLQAARGGLPFEMVALILFSSFVIVGYAVLVGSPDLWFHVLGPAAIAIVVAFSLLVLLDLSYPLSGDVTIDPEPFQSGVLAQFFEPPDERANGATAARSELTSALAGTWRIA